MALADGNPSKRLDEMRERAEAIRDGNEWGPNTGHQLARDVLALLDVVDSWKRLAYHYQSLLGERGLL